MRNRNRVLALACAALCAAGALALTWTWVGLGGNQNWDTCENWDLNFLDPCYPSSTEDDVTVPAAAQPWTIRLITETIDSLSIRGSVNFESAEPQPGAVLDVHEVVIYGTDGQGLVVNLSGAKIWTNH